MGKRKRSPEVSNSHKAAPRSKSSVINLDSHSLDGLGPVIGGLDRSGRTTRSRVVGRKLRSYHLPKLLDTGNSKRAKERQNSKASDSPGPTLKKPAINHHKPILESSRPKKIRTNKANKVVAAHNSNRCPKGINAIKDVQPLIYNLDSDVSSPIAETTYNHREKPSINGHRSELETYASIKIQRFFRLWVLYSTYKTYRLVTRQILKVSQELFKPFHERGIDGTEILQHYPGHDLDYILATWYQEKDSERRNEAARIIQVCWKAYLDKRICATRVIQKSWRVYMSKRNHAATLILRGWRVCRDRKYLLAVSQHIKNTRLQNKINRAATTIQTFMRMVIVRLEYLREKLYNMCLSGTNNIKGGVKRNGLKFEIDNKSFSDIITELNTIKNSSSIRELQYFDAGPRTPKTIRKLFSSESSDENSPSQESLDLNDQRKVKFEAATPTIPIETKCKKSDLPSNVNRGILKKRHVTSGSSSPRTVSPDDIDKSPLRVFRFKKARPLRNHPHRNYFS